MAVPRYGSASLWQCLAMAALRYGSALLWQLFAMAVLHCAMAALRYGSAWLWQHLAMAALGFGSFGTFEVIFFINQSCRLLYPLALHLSIEEVKMTIFIWAGKRWHSIKLLVHSFHSNLIMISSKVALR